MQSKCTKNLFKNRDLTWLLLKIYLWVNLVLVAGSIAAIGMYFDRKSSFQQQNKNEQPYNNSDVKNKFNADVSAAVEKVYYILKILGASPRVCTFIQFRICCILYACEMKFDPLWFSMQSFKVEKSSFKNNLKVDQTSL